MRSLKHLKPHTRSNVVEESGRLVRCYSKVMDRQVDAGTQTDPVVVLSLAQAAVLGLISQNEVFGATIAPNGFYTGEAKECPPAPAGDMEYEYADQLIGANGDYLEEPAEDGGGLPQAMPPGRERRGPGAASCEGGAEDPADGFSEAGVEVKGEGQELALLPPCIHMLNNLIPREGVQLVDPTTYRVAPKEEQQPNNCCPDCEREVRSRQTDTQPGAEQCPPGVGEEEGGPQVLEQQGEPEGQEEEGEENEEAGEEEEDSERPLTSGEEDDGAEMSRYFESSEVGYESGEMGVPGDFEENGQGLMWPEPADGGGEGQPGRRVQIDRLDINVQIDESYCVDVGEGLRRWKCRMCEKSYTSKYNLVTHILGHNGIKPHECPHCGKLFKQPSHLQTHLLTHQGTRPHKCTVCKKAFTQTSHLKRHMLQHTDVKPYSCRFCRRGFAYPSELRAHETKHESGRCHVCPQCGMELPSLAHLKRHQTSHQGPTTYQCSECNKSFAYRSQLQNHLMKHQNVRPFVCAECGMEFVQIHHLKQHALTHKVLTQQAVTHKGMKGFRCDVCSREFTLSANLKRHMLIHASVRPYQCHVCFKTFVQKQTLKTHMIVHLPVKPFKCKVCGKSFNRMYNLLGHMHLHAGSKPFKCPYCSSKFNLKGNLSRHMKVKHGISDTSPDGQDALPEIEGQEDFEEENFDFSAQENLAGNNAQEMAKLSEGAMQEMDYYSFGKEAERYNTA
ncbi:zinc finger protein 710-like [Megalops cyprinoides]|uniref:zinc finger protein 710-like n=1 Tax=Megalops cyprinoides TaxID=118141 RepID=UPI001863B225|nr:zinc finger protein 710-like [Megalops cyprinoides]